MRTLAVPSLLLALLLLLLAAACNSAAAAASSHYCAGSYNTSAQRVADGSRLNVHLVPHTHDDSGWLKTFEQYYWGTRQDIQTAAVQHVLSTVVQALKENPDRRFSYAEMSFFSAWWPRQTPAVQADVRALVDAGRLDFLNGGFVQHDEAAAHYTAMIDQTTRGHRFLNRTFGVTPRVGWQIDPFGHSATQAALMSAAVGFEALFFGRADYQDMHVRASRKQLELLWRPSASWGEYGQIFTHNYPSGNYGPPAGFNWDYGSLDAPIVDDPRSPEYNVPERVDAFVAAAQQWAEQIVGPDVLLMMGSDFQYANAHAWFINLDRLIHHVNLDGRVNVFYSTPADYVAAKAGYSDNSNVSWPVKTDDFFPYADCPHCYWTGYFSSRPTSKGYIRAATSYLNAARQLQALVPHTAASANSNNKQHTQEQQPSGEWPNGGGGCVSGGSSSSSSASSSSSSASSSASSSSSSASSSASLEPLEFAVCLTQHHDAITGTEKQAVANDYARYLYLGMQEAAEVVNAALTHLLTTTPTPPAAAPAAAAETAAVSRQPASTLSWLLQAAAQWFRQGLRQHSSSSSSSHLLSPHAEAGRSTQATGRGAANLGLQLVQCPLLNVSVCGVTVAATTLAPSSRAAPPAAASDGSNDDTVQWQQQQQQQQQLPLRQLRLLPPGSSQLQQLHSQDQQHQAAPTPASSTDSSRNSSSSDNSSGAGVLVVAHNPLAWGRREVLRVPVGRTAAAAGSEVAWRVEDADGSAVPVQLVAVCQATAQLQQGLAQAGFLPGPSAEAAAASHEVVFAVDLPPLGYATYALLLEAHNTSSSSSSDSSSRSSSDGTTPTAAAGAAAAAEEPPAAVYSNGVLSLALHAVTGRLRSVSADDGSWSMQLSQELMWYKSSRGDEAAGAAAAAGAAREAGAEAGNGDQSSGAYIFRPAGDAPEALPLLAADEPVSVTVLTGPVVTEIRQVWSSWASLTTRLYAGADTLEQEWTVGPIPLDGTGKEVVVRTTTDLQTGGVLFSDSNGREMLTRRRDYRPSWPLQVTEPVAGNYYPITAAAAITDGCLTLGLATDRAQGAASLSDGQLEVMLHRVTVVDDARGVGEPLNETLCGCTGAGCDCPAGGLPARGRHTLVLGPANTAAASLRAAQQQLNDPLVLAFADLRQLTAPQTHSPAAAAAGVVAGLGLRGRWSGAADAVLAAGGLPANVHLLTLMWADEDGDPSQLILRLAHTFQVGEDPTWSAPAQVDLQQLLAVPIVHVQELSLTAAQHKDQQHKPRSWPAGEVISVQAGVQDGSSNSASGTWGRTAWRALRQHSSCQPPREEGAEVDRGHNKQQQQGAGSSLRRAQRRAPTQQQQEQQPPLNIWDHSAGDSGSVIELFPQEIRTWQVTVKA